MDILKIATDWVRDEVFSARFFILFGVVLVLVGIGFWQLGRTNMAKAFTWPGVVTGVLLLAVGLGIFFTNKARIKSFEEAYNSDAQAFVQSEIKRTEQSMSEYRNIVFKVIPIIIVVAALIILFVDNPKWRAICMTTIAMMVVILFVDSNANARLNDYHKHLMEVSDGAGGT